MARKCKCKLCGKSLTTDIAYRIKINDKNAYFCNYEESQTYKKRKEDRILLEEYIRLEILNYDEGQRLPNLLYKQINKISESYGDEILLETFKQQTKTIKYYNQHKDFKNEGMQIMYIMAIINNNINTVYKNFKLMKKQEKINKKFQIDIDMFNKTKDLSKKNKTKDISSFLEEGDF